MRDAATAFPPASLKASTSRAKTSLHEGMFNSSKKIVYILIFFYVAGAIECRCVEGTHIAFGEFITRNRDA